MKKTIKLVDYEKFIKMSTEVGERANEQELSIQILKEFYPKDKRPWNDCVEEFKNSLAIEKTFEIKLDLNFENKPADYFITAEGLLRNADLVGLYNHLSSSNVKGISVQLAKQVRTSYLRSIEYFKMAYPWIYNPPTVGKPSKHTAGKVLRQEFAEYYGAYAEITYLLSKGDALKFNEVEQMKLSEYLAFGEYLIRKRIVENYE